MSFVMICGLGEVGYRVSRLLLDLGEEVTVVTIEARNEWLRLLEKRGAKICIGDARDESFLEESGIADAKAVIACSHNDSANVEILLDVHRLYPGKRTIARIVDPSLARHAEKHLGVHRAISMTAAAAPVFAAATYGENVLTEFDAGSDRFMALRMEGPQRLHEAPLVVISAAGQCQHHDKHELDEGESAVVMVRAESMREEYPKRRRRHSLLKALAPTAVFKFVGNVWNNTAVQLRAVLIAIFTLIVVSVAVFQVTMKLSTIDALYFVVTTATTVGYGDITPKDASAWLKAYTCFMMIVSATGLAVVFSVVTDYLLTARLLQLVGRHHIPDHGHILVVGVGVVGHRTVEELVRLKAPVVAIDRAEDGEYLSTIRAKVHVVIGDGREEETLRRAGVRHAKAIIVTTANDGANLSIGLTAKEINPDIRVVLSISDAEFAQKIETIGDIDAALSSPVLAAPSFVGAALYDDAVAAFRLDSTFFVLRKDREGKVKLGGEQMTLDFREIGKR